MGTPGAAVRSIRPYGSSQQYLYAMKEDLAEWLKELYELDIEVSTFMEVLETGAVLCSHANHITRVAEDFAHSCPSAAQHLHLPSTGVSCNPAAQPGTFQARDNVSNFIQWCRKEMDINDVLMFETEDLVLRKNEKNFVLCLLELARRAARFGMCAPTLVQMEEEIEEELRQEMDPPPADTPPSHRPPRKPRNLHNLDQMVQHLVSRCTCPVQFPMIKVSDGKYRVGDSDTLIFVRILREHVMVRVGGGWDTLEHYLDKHDPCRCTSLSHKQLSRTRPPQQPVQHEVRLCAAPSAPGHAHPTLLVSRSQSPLPPITWAPHGHGHHPWTHTNPSPHQEPKQPRRVPSCRTPTPRSPARTISPGLGAAQRAPTPSRGTVGTPREPHRNPPKAAAQNKGTAPSAHPAPPRPKSTQQGGGSSRAASSHVGAPTSVTPRAHSPIKNCASSLQQDAHRTEQGRKSPREGNWRTLGRNHPSSHPDSLNQPPKQDSNVKTPKKTSSTICRPPTPLSHFANGCESPQCPPPSPMPRDDESPVVPRRVSSHNTDISGLRGNWGHSHPPDYGKVLEELTRNWQPLRPVGMGNSMSSKPPTTPCANIPAGGSMEGPAVGDQTTRSTVPKARRCLKKPERVPSIYKLKLRPKVRPRRDHRPGKGPSRIPTPLGHRLPRTRGQHRPTALPKSPQPRDTKSDSSAWLTEDDEEAWV